MVVVWVWAGGWVVCVWYWYWGGGYVAAQVDACYCYCCRTKQCARCRPQAEKISCIFAVKHNEKAIDNNNNNKLYISAISLYPTISISDYISDLYPTISHHIPSHPHNILPFPTIFFTISHHIPPPPTISKPAYPKDIRQRGALFLYIIHIITFFFL